jgi:uncharacterized protein (DUF1501 family)
MSRGACFDRYLTRREVLRCGLYSLGVGTGLPLLLRTASAFATTTQDSAETIHPERILVIVELSGGNDGLNTVVPFADDVYYRNRPTLGVPAAQVRKIDDHFGFHPAMAGFERLYKDGKLAIVHGCGYANPSLSHFTSMGFWHTGVPNAGEKLGWVGRLADAVDPQGQRNYIVNVATSQSLAVRSSQHMPLVFYDPDDFKRSGVFQQQPVFQRLSRARHTANPSLDFLTAVAENATESAAFVRQAWAEYKTPVDYGVDSAGLGVDLRKVAALIKAGMPTRLYYVSYAGNVFDTHVYQADLHTRLLTYTADALRAFVEDMARLGCGSDVAVMVFTEFGRRVPENASKGTDHGTATPMFVIGSPVKGGQYGTPPNLTTLDDGNLIYTTDFRRVYATLITEWLRYDDPASLLKGEFRTLGIFV